MSVVAERLYAALGPMTQQDVDYGWPLLKLCQAVSAPVADVDALASETDNHPVWGPLFDPTLAPAKALPWLGQLVGAIVPAGTSETVARQIVTHSPGWARGTPAAVVAAARMWLTGAQRVLLNERFGGSAYAAQVRVYAAETVDVTKLTAAVRAALPAGFSLAVDVIAGWLVSEMESALTGQTVAYAEANWASVAAFEQQLP